VLKVTESCRDDPSTLNTNEFGWVPFSSPRLAVDEFRGPVILNFLVKMWYFICEITN
jgi:hypothetical protein